VKEHVVDINVEQLLKSCGERLTKEDVALLDTCARMVARPGMTLMEIGSAGGCSSVILARIAQEHSGKLICVDPQPEARWYNNIQPYENNIILIKGYSPWIDSYTLQAEEILAIHADSYEFGYRYVIDFLLIDGNHKTRWVLVDYHYWFPYVREDSIIVFHDWNEARPGTDGYEVKRAIEIILETDADKLEMVMEAPGKANRGSIAFRKVRHEGKMPKL
jgi:predicted O-methyltransferase YrrM